MPSSLLETDILAYLKQHEHKDLLRFITCGSVDDGKSTLIGRLLHDSKMIYEDQLAAISRDSKTHGTTGETVDLALLVDGLQSEREQGITIDVAYRYFSTDRRKFIIADTPGHEQYTRNMATGASTANLAILLIDARYGVQTQTKRHSFICSLLGIKHFVVAVNKMDLVDYEEACFEAICRDYYTFSEALSLTDLRMVPMSALLGENVVSRSENMPWYNGAPLLEILETLDLTHDDVQHALRFPVQYVNRPHLNFRGYCGTVASGVIRPGMAIKALPSGKESTVTRILLAEETLDAAWPGDAVTLTISDEIDISRGDMIVAAEDDVVPATTILIDVVWMHEDPLQLDKPYRIKIGTMEIAGTVDKIEYQTDVNTLNQQPTNSVGLNGIARCRLVLTEPVTVDSYRRSRRTGNLIFIDRLSNITVGAGMVVEVVNQAPHAIADDGLVTRQLRAERYGQMPAVIWFTGLSGSGKSTTAGALENRLFQMGYNTFLLDGDAVRGGLCRDLGFSDSDRVENIRRVGEVAKLLMDAGQIVLVAFISPFQRERDLVRDMVGEKAFFEVFVKTPLSICESRDPKGLYQKARLGEIQLFTGIDSPYEAPQTPDITIDTSERHTSDLVMDLVRALRLKGIIT